MLFLGKHGVWAVGLSCEGNNNDNNNGFYDMGGSQRKVLFLFCGIGGWDGWA